MLIFTCNSGFSQKKSFLDFQIGGVRSISQSDFVESNVASLNSGKIMPSVSVLFSSKILNPNVYLTTGLNLSYRNVQIQQNIDTLSYFGIIYAQPKYRVISVPVLLNFQKKIDLNFSPVFEKIRTMGISTGFSIDFVKEVLIKNGMTIGGKGFNIRTSYKNNFAFKSNTGVSFNCSLSLPLLKFKNNQNLNLVGVYKYPFYTQNNLKLNYVINGDSKDFEIKKLRLQEISIGLSFCTAR